MFDWSEILATNTVSGSVYLSATSRSLIVSCLSLMLEFFRWRDYSTNGDDIDAAVSQALYEVMHMAVGQVIWVLGDAPSNTLECDGSTYLRVDYPALYAVLPAAYIVDADNFRVPDLRGRVPMGAGAGYAVGDTGGEGAHTLTIDEMPTHDHVYVPPVLNFDLETPGVPDILGAGIGVPTSTGDTGGDQPHNNLQPFEVLRPCLIAM